MNSASVMRINSHLSEINSVVEDIVKLLDSFKVDKPASFDIRLCLQEALINAIKHGNKNNNNLPITITYSVAKDRFEVSVQDNGSGFDYKKIPNPTDNENLLKTSGRGIYLIKYLMDEVSFNKNGNKITMIKYLKGGNHADK